MSKLLGSGGFACVFYPGITCQGKVDENTNFVTKIQRDDKSSNSEREIEIGQDIMNIPNFSFYFAPVTNSCSINLNTINDNQESVLDQCKLIKSLDQNYIALRIPYVDKDNFFTFLTNTDNAIFSFATMMETMKYLLSSIHKLIQARLVQFDLKGENIVFKKDLSIPIIIDFGISIQIDEVTSENLSEYFYTYAPDYYIWPIDVHLLCYLASVKNILQKEDIKKICDECITNNIIFQTFSESFITDYKEKAYEYYLQYAGKSRSFTLKELLKGWNTWDLYSYGILGLRLANYLFLKTIPNNPIMEKFIQIHLYNIHYNPSKRYSINKNIKQFNKLHYKEGNRHRLIELIKSINYSPTKLKQTIQKDSLNYNPK